MANIDGRWVTMNGARVFISDRGDVIMGLGQKGLSADQRNAIIEYTTGSWDLNASINNGKLSSHQKELSELLSSAISENKVTQDLTLYRKTDYAEITKSTGLDLQTATIDDVAKKIVGKTIYRKAFTSTSKDGSDRYDKVLGKAVVYKINIKSGSKAIDVDDVLGIPRGQSEVILDKGQSLVVIGASVRGKRNNQLYLDVNLVNKVNKMVK